MNAAAELSKRIILSSENSNVYMNSPVTHTLTFHFVPKRHEGLQLSLWMLVQNVAMCEIYWATRGSVKVWVLPHAQSHVRDGRTIRVRFDKVAERNPIKCYVILLCYYTDRCKWKKKKGLPPPSTKQFLLQVALLYHLHGFTWIQCFLTPTDAYTIHTSSFFLSKVICFNTFFTHQRTSSW
jgi:hypothetical protein